jgi:hypothetical protein
MDNRDYEKQLDSTKKLISNWAGADAVLWSYSPSHRGLVIRLFSSKYLSCLDLRCSELHFICGPTKWSNSLLQIEKREGAGLILKDATVAFEAHLETIDAVEKPV